MGTPCTESDPAELLSKADYREGECLTADKIGAVKKVYAGPTTSKGEKIYTGGPLPGSELNWMNDEPCCAYVNGAGRVARWSGDYFAFIGFMPAPDQAGSRPILISTGTTSDCEWLNHCSALQMTRICASSRLPVQR